MIVVYFPSRVPLVRSQKDCAALSAPRAALRALCQVDGFPIVVYSSPLPLEMFEELAVVVVRVSVRTGGSGACIARAGVEAAR
jgi:hypothetical protein